MKTSSLGTVTPCAEPLVKTTAPAADAAAGTDFLALFAQLVAGAAAPANTAVTSVPVAADEDTDADTDPDGSDWAALMAALAAAPPTQPVANAPVASGIDKGVASAGDKAIELRAAMLDAVAGQGSAGVAADALSEVDFDSTLASLDGGSNSIDPRAAHSAMDLMRDSRAPAQVDTPIQRQLHTPVGSRAWSEELGAQVTWMTDRGHQSASLRLSPEHLGPIEVQISIQDDQASVWFGAAHADTRAAIENALPRLREMLAGQGLALNDSGVFKESPRQHSHTRMSNEPGTDPTANGDGVAATSISRLGLVDAYA
jgi:flagellar hook-length control protein FliK